MTAPDNGHLRRADIRLPVFRCGECDVFFLNPPPPPELGRDYFAGAYAGRTEGNIYYDDGFKDRTSRIRLELLTRHEPAGRTLLDVGCGKGRFVRVARDAGWDAWGAELDEGACEYARQQLGLETVRHGTLDHPDLPSQFDVITLWDVIEHVQDPVSVLRDVALRLRDGGLAAVRTANIRSWAFDRHRSKWWAFGVDHRFYFSPGSLEVAMRLAGLDVVAVVNGEIAERPDKKVARDISDTPVAEGLRALTRTPAKLASVGRYAVNRIRRTVGERRYGAHYRTSIMTLIARRARTGGAAAQHRPE